MEGTDPAQRYQCGCCIAVDCEDASTCGPLVRRVLRTAFGGHRTQGAGTEAYFPHLHRAMPTYIGGLMDQILVRVARRSAGSFLRS